MLLRRIEHPADRPAKRRKLSVVTKVPGKSCQPSTTQRRRHRHLGRKDVVIVIPIAVAVAVLEAVAVVIPHEETVRRAGSPAQFGQR